MPGRILEEGEMVVEHALLGTIYLGSHSQGDPSLRDSAVKRGHIVGSELVTVETGDLAGGLRDGIASGKAVRYGVVGKGECVPYNRNFALAHKLVHSHWWYLRV